MESITDHLHAQCLSASIRFRGWECTKAQRPGAGDLDVFFHG